MHSYVRTPLLSGRAIGLALAFLAALGAPGDTAAQGHAHEAPAPFTGMWQVTFESQMGRMSWTFTLDMDDGALSGIAEAESGSMPVEGHQEGEIVDFVVQVEAPDHSVTLEFEGTVEDDAASGTVTIFDGTYDWTAERIVAR